MCNGHRGLFVPTDSNGELGDRGRKEPRKGSVISSHFTSLLERTRSGNKKRKRIQVRVAKLAASTSVFKSRPMASGVSNTISEIRGHPTDRPVVLLSTKTGHQVAPDRQMAPPTSPASLLLNPELAPTCTNLRKLEQTRANLRKLA